MNFLLCPCLAMGTMVPWVVADVNDKLDGRVIQAIAGGNLRPKIWVHFRDKGDRDGSAEGDPLQQLREGYNARAIQRRIQRRTSSGLFDERDLPLHGPYLQAITDLGLCVENESRWANSVSVYVTLENIDQLLQLPCVSRISLVASAVTMSHVPIVNLASAQAKARGGDFYGLAFEQLTQITIPAVHDAGFTGQGIVIGILDTGFQRTHEAFNNPGHPLNVIAEYDFVSDDSDTSAEEGDHPDQHHHGTLILGTIGAYMPGELVGGAYDATFILAKTEDVSQEVPMEEDQYVAGLEFIEANGGDVATSSLGYIDWYTWFDLDGQTAVTSIAVNTATDNGLVCVTAAGNGGQDQDLPSIIAPADAFRVLSIGAVDSAGNPADFTSNGPTADGRVKPEIATRGVDTLTVSYESDTEYVGASGTSLSTPLAACAAALLVQAHPDWTVDHIRTALFENASIFAETGSIDPLYLQGYGIIDTDAARQMLLGGGDFDNDGDVDLVDFGAFQTCFSGEDIGLTNPEMCRIADFDGDNDVDLDDYSDFRATRVTE